MVLPFDIQGGSLLAAARGGTITALLSAFGVGVFRDYVLPRALARAPEDVSSILKRRLRRLMQASAAAGLFAAAAWLIAQSADLADAGNAGEVIAAMPTVVLRTAFGHVIAGQMAALAAVLLALAWRDGPVSRRVSLGLAALALCLQAGHSHAASMYAEPGLLLGCDILHLLGAGAWLGGLVPLLLVVARAPPPVGAAAARWFSPLGKFCIAALVLSAAVQGWVLVASIPGLVGTAYGWMVLVKLALFGVLLGFAAANRYRFAPALARGGPDAARRVLVWSVLLQTAFALAIVAAAVVLSELPPPMHLQALWPFSQQISLDAAREDPDIRQEVVLAGAALGGALVVFVVAVAIRRFRMVAFGVLAVVGWLAMPHFSVLLADAYPTSFYHSPTGFSAESIADGSALFARNCASCHGAGGAGDGVLAKHLAVKPADLTAGHLWMHSDGELFWWVTNGIKSPRGVKAMPGFADVLDDDQRWAVIDFVRANNAGVSFHTSGRWPNPIHAPALTAQCGAKTMQLADLHGHFVRLVIGPAAPSGDANIVTIATSGGPAQPDVCVAAEETIQAAYRIVTGGTVAIGTQFLIDGDGWLRAAGTGWNDPKTLQAEIDRLRTHPIKGAMAPMKM